MPEIRCFSVAPSRNSMAMKGLSVLFANLVDGADVGVVQRRCGFGFAPKTDESLRVFGYIVWKEFQGDEAIKFDVLGLVDHAHAAATELFDDAVVGNGTAEYWCGISHWRRMLGCAYRQVNRGCLQADASGNEKRSRILFRSRIYF